MAQKGIPTTVLVAPDSFKGTLTAAEVAAAIGRGLSDAGREVDLCPVADGGEGTAAALEGPLALELVEAEVGDPLGRPVTASFGLGSGVAVIETAAASGLGPVPEDDRDAVAASTSGTGGLIAAAIDAGADTIYLGVGGSATTDGGAGAIKAISAAGGLRAAKLTVLCDVRTPFEDAARVFAPQKGASNEDVRRLSARLHALARRLDRDPRGVPMSGAAGGLAGGLWARFGAQLLPGAPFVLEALDFDARMLAARAVIVGEGQIDTTTLEGKAAGEIATRARQRGVPAHAIVGRRAIDRFDARILDLQEILEASTPQAIEQAAAALAATL